jgi:hypothetical protein
VAVSAGVAFSVGLKPAAPPFAPSDVTAVRIAKLTARIDWADNSYDEDGFNIERQRRVGNAWTESTMFVVGANATTFTNVVPTKGTYRYRVQAFNGSGTSTWSNWAQVVLN